MANFLDLPVTATFDDHEVNTTYAIGEVPITLTVGANALKVGPCQSADWALLAQACRDGGSTNANLERLCWVEIEDGVVALTVDTNDVVWIAVKLSAAACVPAFLEAASIDARYGRVNL